MSARPPISNVADTARWVALYRAIESERPDALFSDPFARRLAGPQGAHIMASLPRSMRNAQWSVVARTWTIDRYVMEQVAAGVTMVVNLAAGLDTRPYRMSLPPDLLWVEVDQAHVIAEKAAALADATPRCRVERVAADLADAGARRVLLDSLAARSRRILVITEGLLMYLSPDAVAALAEELHALPAVATWVTDVISPGLLKMIDKDWGDTLRAGNAPMHFAPREGSAWFERFGWHVEHCESGFSTAHALGRLPWLLRFFALFPSTHRFNPDQPWAGHCLLTRRETGNDRT